MNNTIGGHMQAGKDILGRAVIGAGSGRLLGAVIDVLFDDSGGHVSGLVFQGVTRRSTGRTSIIPFGCVQQFGKDAIAVTERPVQAVDRALGTPSGGALEGKPVISARGRLLGTVRDVIFDEHSGRVVAYQLASWSPRHMCRRRSVVSLLRSAVVGDVIILGEAPERRET
jgi:uncharacterized protein YrrD